jgi:ABC-type glycerol-3-phosphate transport system permease component
MRKSRLGTAAAYVALGAAMIVALFPVFWTASTSIKNRVDTFADPPRFVSFTPTLKNYRQLFDDPTFVHACLVTLGLTLGSTLIAVSFGAFAGYALARRDRFPGRRPLEASLVLVRALPGVVLIVPLYDLFSRLHLYDNLAALTIVYAAVNVPFAAWLMMSFFRQVPFELEEASEMDGASRPQTFVRVLFPLAMPGLAATSIFVALLAWNEFLIPALLAGGENKTLPVYISTFISNRTLDWGPMAAAATIAIVPIAIITVLVQRQLVAGLSSGAVKD